MGNNGARLKAVTILILLVFFAIILRIAFLQTVKHKFYSELSVDQRTSQIKLASDRGDIFDRNGILLATSKDTFSVFVRPRAMEDKERVLSALLRSFPPERKLIEEKFARNSAFWLVRKKDKRTADLAKSIKSTEIDIFREKKRVYPKGHFASQLIGTVGLDNDGLSGIEYGLDKELRGVEGQYIFEKDVRGQQIATGFSKEIQKPLSGMDVYLTIDESIQYVAERELKKAAEKYRPESASITVMDVRTGEILAIASLPDFDPNYPSKFPIQNWKLRPMTDMYEPGSTFKIITAASGIEYGLVGPDTPVPCPPKIVVGGRTISNSHAVKAKNPTLRDVIAESLNTGTTYVSLKIGKERFYQHIKAFGFGEKTGTGYPGEAKGLLPTPNNWHKSAEAMISFGQTISVTPIQLLTAAASIANSGVRVKPSVVSVIESPDKSIVKANSTETRGNTVSAATCEKVADLMRGVALMPHGTGHKAKLLQYSTAVKTGTAQKVIPGAGYIPMSAQNFVASIVGFVPAKEPRIAIIVVLDHPKGTIWGAVAAAPVFKEVGEFTLRYLDAAPDL